MPKILVRDEWYHQIASTALYEGEFERIFLQNASSVFPGFFVVPFKPLVHSEYGSAKPDLALIDHLYRNWWVVEVEMSHHSLSGHVMPQVQILASGEYNEYHVRNLVSHDERLNSGSLAAMLKGQQPQVLVVANRPCPEWVPVLRRFGAILTVFEIFRSEHDRQVFRLNGEQPELPRNLLSICEFDRLVPKFLRLLSPAAFPSADGEVVRIEYNGTATIWKRVDAQDAAWLVPIGPNPLTAGFRFEIKQSESGDLSIHPSAKPR